VREFGKCLEVDADCVPCLRALGWTHWARSEWDRAEEVWQKILDERPGDDKARDAIANARRQAKLMPSLRAPVGEKATGGGATLELVAKIQGYDPNPTDDGDTYDEQVHSPKSARFTRDGKKVYVNALEGKRTLIYDAASYRKLGTIEHTFRKGNAKLFQGDKTLFDYRFTRKSRLGHPNYFRGKPVESELSHGGKYLWVPYYRRDFDRWATSPSAVAIIDTATDRIVRVMPTGPIPKYVVASPDDRYMAVIHWGDNTVGLIDTSSGDPKKFRYVAHMVAGDRLDLSTIKAGVSRDAVCGHCLRGAVFTPDGRELLVARMTGGGLAGFDVEERKYLGVVGGIKPTPRHLVLSPDGKTIYASSNSSGYVSKAPLADVIADLRGTGDAHWQAVDVGRGARTIELSPDGNYIFAAVNISSRLVMVDARTMKVVARLRLDSFPVGLAVSPDGRAVWVTAQGRRGKASGNTVSIVRVSYP
jgi:DNA-binding beta-propeller fold protein YncE